MTDADRAIVVGIGQDAAGDDAVGLRVARALAERSRDIEVRASSDASVILSLLEDGERVVIVDAVVGGGEPGAVLRLSPKDLGDDILPLSSHGISVKSALEMAQVLYGADVSRLVSLVGVVIERPGAPSHGLSPEVERAIAPAASMARAIALEAP